MTDRAKRLTKGRLHEMYRTMVRIRRFEEKAHEFFRGGRVCGPVHFSVGQEACSAGVCANLNPDDAILTTHRCHGHSIAKGTDMGAMFAELLGKAGGICGGKGGSMHIADVSKGHYGAHSVVGANMPLAAGIGLAFDNEAKGRVVVVFFGDGASNQGSFHESLNLCAIWNLPVVFFCENNQYAGTTPVERSTSVRDISDRARGYGIPGVTVDGMDLVAVYEGAAGAVRRARGGEGPSLIEAKTYRFYGHSRGDPPHGLYRTKEEHDEWLKRDPLLVAERVLEMTEAERREHHAAVEKEVREGVEFAERSPEPGPGSALTEVFAD